MMKLLIAFAGLLAVCSAQQARYPYSAYLDTDGYFLLNWDVRTTQKDIEMQLKVNATGWVSLLIASEDGTFGDLIWGGFSDVKGRGYLSDLHVALLPGPSHGAPLEDASQDLVQQSITYEAPFTIITIKRSIFTGDMDDVAIRPGPMLLGWSFSDKDSAPEEEITHTNAGFATLALIPA